MNNHILKSHILDPIAEFWTSILDFGGQAWWIEVLTDRPKCMYYFGPFADLASAKLAVAGYVADLEGESAQGIETQIKRCKPDRLTIDLEDMSAV
ncbi:DUF1816 domain-containing protein [Chamaesiphon sp. VAR_69_metabat_338]|uniref:DUF1816 domain-containing protein n=1 Tax=Chamaesiphon sp. VAR_69_metabat_338 TaxID=2964704 RepID=UPI00286E3E05|nr:DUF1816 domain-containing protein [Chamaesiphon sp. VAR_69_metabat_338]